MTPRGPTFIPIDLEQRTAEIIGGELRRLRNNRGWTLSTMCARLAADTGHEIACQTLASYELGTRTASVFRLAALCYTLGVRTVDIWSTVETELFGREGDDIVHVDLRKVAEIEHADLAPVRAWARTQLGGNTWMVALTPLAITSLATVCGLDATDVRAALHATEVEEAGRA